MGWDIRELDPEWPFELAGTDFLLEPARTALLVVDVQAGCRIEPNRELSKQCPELAAYFNGRLEKQVIPNTLRLLGHFRDKGLKVAFARNGPITRLGEERSERLRKKGKPVCYRGTAGYEIDERLSPRDDEIVVDKLTSGAFTATYLDHALRNMNIKGLVIVGVVTDMCIFGTARTGAELGYDVVICEDACAAYTERTHNEALLMHARRFGRVVRTDDVIAELDSDNKE